jgi:probable HAF family extracellular repeat protein
VGFSRSSSSVQHAFLWENGVMTDLHAVILTGEGGGARGINSDGIIVGWDATTTEAHGFLIDNSSVTTIGTLGGDVSVAYDVNDHGHVVGTSNRAPGPPFYAFLWKDGEMTDLAALGGFDGSSRAIAINNRGEVVINGEIFYDPILGIQNAWELIPGDSGWAYLVLQDINESSQLVGSGSINGQLHAFLMTPIPPIPGIPTVSSWGLVVLVLLFVTSSKVLFTLIRRCDHKNP